MIHVRFIDYYEHVEPARTIPYLKGTEAVVAKAIGDAAIAAGKAEEVKPEPVKAEKPAKPASGE